MAHMLSINNTTADRRQSWRCITVGLKAVGSFVEVLKTGVQYYIETNILV